MTMIERRNYSGSVDWLITDIKPNEKLPGSKARHRYALYVDGMSVAQYVFACKSTGAPRAGDALLDIQWDIDHGFIKVGKPSTQL
jgi:hypothetical protein